MTLKDVLHRKEKLLKTTFFQKDENKCLLKLRKLAAIIDKDLKWLSLADVNTTKNILLWYLQSI